MGHHRSQMPLLRSVSLAFGRYYVNQVLQRLQIYVLFANITALHSLILKKSLESKENTSARPLT